MVLLKSLVAGVASAVLVGALLAIPVLADGREGTPGNGYGYGYGDRGDRPGWGYGDDNHEHTGPPGLDGKDEPGKSPKPGKGNGDDNHEHSGPPGLDKQE